MLAQPSDGWISRHRIPSVLKIPSSQPSFSRQPSMSVPLHWTAEGLPVGVQLVGARRKDRTLLALAAELEQACPWVHRWPPIALEA